MRKTLHKAFKESIFSVSDSIKNAKVYKKHLPKSIKPCAFKYYSSKITWQKKKKA